MRYLSLFSGIEAATVAWKPLGWEAVGFAEIEPFPCAVLKHYYPSVPNLGSVTDVTEGIIKKLGVIDLVVFGSPCQDLSVAGNRKGLNGERSGLFYDAVRIIRWARKHGGCRFALWENVPGAYSSNKGEDFAEVLRLLTGTDQPRPETWRYAGFAFGKTGLTEWRTCDAQFYGVPQRRRRIFALTDFGDWAGRPPILFESESLCGDSAAGGEAGKDTTSPIAAGVGEGDGERWPAKTACTLTTCYADKMGLEDQHINSGAPLFVESEQFDFQGIAQYGNGEKESTQAANSHYKSLSDLVVFNPKDDPVNSDKVSIPLQAQTAGNSSALAIPIHDKATRHASKRGDKQDGAGNGLGVGKDGGVMNTLTAGDRHAVFCLQGSMIGRSNSAGPQGSGLNENTSFTLNTADHHAVCFQQNHRDEVRLTGGDGKVTGLLSADSGAKQQNYIASSSEAELAIRRLTPVECERLQGFPDFYTAIPWKKKPAEECPDGPRYKALGNSMSVPVMRWIGKRIDKVIN